MKRSYKLLAFAIAALSCSGIAPAFADDPVTGSTNFTVTVNPYLNLTLSSADMSAGNIIHLPLTPSSSGTYGSKSLTATASTNNAYGYTLVMSTPHTYLESNTINVNDGTYPHIEAITSRTGGRTAAEFEANTYNDMNKWGISIDNTTSYNPIALSQNLKKVTTPIADSTTTINMATILDLLTPPGSYSTTMNFELVANAATGSLEQALIDAGKEKVTVGNNKYYKIQDVNTAICNATTDTTGILEVVDVRDNTIYHIGKLADQRCWLLDNLALDLSDSNVKNALTEENTNATTASISTLKSNVANTTSGFISFTNPQINKNYKNDISSDSLDASEQWKVGVYYNFCAASAASYCYESGYGVDTPNTAIDATEDICPSGWRLPTGGKTPENGGQTNGGEYDTLYSQYSSAQNQYDVFRRALRAPLAGYYYHNNGTQGQYGTYGGFHSSTNFGGENMYLLTFGTNSVYTVGSGYGRHFGFSVRCIVKN